MERKRTLGQFFTVNEAVLHELSSLIGSQPGKVLEPSAGVGHIASYVACHNAPTVLTCWELDESLESMVTVLHGDFFELSKNRDNDFDTIVGNPPFVAWKHVTASTQAQAASVKARYSDKTNLYHLFMDKCIDLLAPGGQLVFIVPKEWLYATSAAPLREKMSAEGSITHIIDIGEEKVFPDADVPSLMIFRFEKGRKETLHFKQGLHGSWEERFLSRNGSLWSISKQRQQGTMMTVGDIFDVKVGMVSGADKIFNVSTNPLMEAMKAEGTVRDFITTKGVEQFIFADDFDTLPPITLEYLLPYKEALLSRKIAKFSEDNWWKFGAVRNRLLMEGDRQRLYAYGRTRRDKPFFAEGNHMFSGGILGLFAKEPHSEEEMRTFFHALNSHVFMERCREIGLVTGNKVSFQPATLSLVSLL